MTDEEGSDRGTYFTADEDGETHAQAKRPPIKMVEVGAERRMPVLGGVVGNGSGNKNGENSPGLGFDSPDPPALGGMRGMMGKLGLQGHRSLS